MESRASFPTVSAEFLRGTSANSIDTGHIPTPVTSQETHGPQNQMQPRRAFSRTSFENHLLVLKPH